MHKYRIALYIFLFTSIALFTLTSIDYCKAQIPDTIRINAGSSQEIDLGIPVFGTVQTTNSLSVDKVSIIKQVNFSEPLTIIAGDNLESCQMSLKLFGIFPVKNVDIQVIENTMLTPVGSPIGIYLKTQGVLVIDTGSFREYNKVLVCPCENKLRQGDYLLRANDEEIANKRQVKNIIENSNGMDIRFELLRDGELLNVNVTPVKDENNIYKLGMWLRDSAQGIGTMTYIDSNNNFGALGHGINDIDTGALLSLGSGLLYNTQILSIQKGKSGTPGELTGVIEYKPENVSGIITSNTFEGIYGITTQNNPIINKLPKAIPIMLKKDAIKGNAQVYCNINGESNYYNIEILKLTPGTENTNRQITFEVTDERLLTLTGGIVQGMSGAPIVKDGHFLGAVTHVLIDDPKKGYGIFIEDMLMHTKN